MWSFRFKMCLNSSSYAIANMRDGTLANPIITRPVFSALQFLGQRKYLGVYNMLKYNLIF